MKKISESIIKNKKQLITGLLISFLIFTSVFIFALVKKTAEGLYMPAIIITQAGISMIWLVARFGGFSILSSSTRKLGTSVRDRKMNKLGGYNADDKKKDAKKPWEIEQEAKLKSKSGIYLMWIIATLEIAIFLPFII